ncbi:MAG: phosphoenolpyruvate carboxylase [Pseudohongiellaceae bacterium]
MPEKKIEAYENLVELKYQLYNGLFLTLPLDAIEQTGLFLPLLDKAATKGLDDGLDPTEIIEKFFALHRPNFSESDQIQFLFKVIQYIERQIVLVDALEEASYDKIHQTEKRDELRKLIERVSGDSLEDAMRSVMQSFSARVILTAHPTQFYPGPVLAIISDLQDAVNNDDIASARTLLQQLGNTPFFNKTKPSPKDEAVQLTWYLSNIFYPTIGNMLDEIADQVGGDEGFNDHLLSIGFWPGGDRDGNPFVNAETTEEVASKLRTLIIECYYHDIRYLKRRLSFNGVQESLDIIEKKLAKELGEEGVLSYMDVNELLSSLAAIEATVVEKYQGLYVDKLASFRRKISAFGFHFASLDIRQDARQLGKILLEIDSTHPELFPANWLEQDQASRIETLLSITGEVDVSLLSHELAKDTLDSMQSIKKIQHNNGELGCHRYIISNCSGVYDMAVMIALFRLSGWGDDPITVDLVPLFETVSDLKDAGPNMTQLYELPLYKKHLSRRSNKQTVMLGFSDGTKDGGYLMANWGIYRAKEDITRVSREAGVEVLFFDGRGGPPARGGGNTYKFYAAHGKKIESNEIQVTIQGQTISSYFGTPAAARHNLNQLLAAGIENNLYDRPERELAEDQRQLIDKLANTALDKYLALKGDPLFLPYLEQMSPMHFYGQSNIASRPSKRGGDSALKFEDLRAIPFVGAWGQLKQNVPGFYGVGTALKAAEEQGLMPEMQDLCARSKFFKALMENSMQSMRKANFKLTTYMAEHPTYGGFWKTLLAEFELTQQMILKVSGQTQLLGDNPYSRESIDLRQRVVLPLLVIQQYALIKVNESEQEGGESRSEMAKLYEKMIIRSLFGNINASRNSA